MEKWIVFSSTFILFAIFLICCSPPVHASPYSVIQNPHPLTPVTGPTKFGNGTMLQLMIIYNTSPTEDTGLADYNKAVNFEKAKPIILSSSNPQSTLQSLINELQQQIIVIQNEGKNVKRYNPDGTETQTYSDWWMQNYVVYRLQADGFQAVLYGLQQGMSLQTAFNNVDQDMQKIINNYSLNINQTATTNPNTTPNQSQPTTSSKLSVTTDKQSYVTGDTIVITGTADPSLTTTQYLAGVPNPIVSKVILTIQVFDSASNLVLIRQMDVDNTGKFSMMLSTYGTLWKNPGLYTVTAQQGNTNKVSAQFWFNYNGGTIPQSTNQNSVTTNTQGQSPTSDKDTQIASLQKQLNDALTQNRILQSKLTELEQSISSQIQNMTQKISDLTTENTKLKNAVTGLKEVIHEQLMAMINTLHMKN